MVVLLRSETEAAIHKFLQDEIQPQDFEGWIISAIDDLPEAERDPLWELRLLLIENGEGLRPLDEVKQRARELLAENAA